MKEKKKQRKKEAVVKEFPHKNKSGDINGKFHACALRKTKRKD